MVLPVLFYRRIVLLCVAICKYSVARVAIYKYGVARVALYRCMVLLCVAIHKYGVACVATRCMVLIVLCVAPLFISRLEGCHMT